MLGSIRLMFRKQSSYIEFGLLAALIVVGVAGVILTLGPTLAQPFPQLRGWLP
jgi:Flp pilus assembly pilin Flp